MFNDEEVVATEEPKEEQEQGFGPHLIIFLDEGGEVQIATKGKQFHPEEITKMLEVAVAKINLMQFQMMLQQMMAQQSRQQNPLLIARRDVGGLNI